MDFSHLYLSYTVDEDEVGNTRKKDRKGAKSAKK
jgi:hypothetical protein